MIVFQQIVQHGAILFVFFATQSCGTAINGIRGVCGCVRESGNVCDVELSCERFVLCLHVCCFCLGSDTLDVFYWFRCGTHFQAGQGGHRQFLLYFQSLLIRSVSQLIAM